MYKNEYNQTTLDRNCIIKMIDNQCFKQIIDLVAVLKNIFYTTI